MRASFSDEDRKVKLETLYDRLSAVVFHERLGNLKEKSERIRQIALFVGRSMGVDPQAVERASALLKTDLLTHMVGEFPELQGVMGRMYALAQGEEGRRRPVDRGTLLPDRHERCPARIRPRHGHGAL